MPPRVEFRLGEIENLPAGDNTVDAVISNCVINLSPDKPRVLREALRVLKPGKGLSPCIVRVYHHSSLALIGDFHSRRARAFSRI